jgi:hypothetical protein
MMFPQLDTVMAHMAYEHGLAPDWQSLECPLCLQQTGDGRSVISLHIARHMEEIALSALPTSPDSDSDSDGHSNPASLAESDDTEVMPHDAESHPRNLDRRSPLPSKRDDPAEHSSYLRQDSLLRERPIESNTASQAGQSSTEPKTSEPHVEREIVNELRASSASHSPSRPQKDQFAPAGNTPRSNQPLNDEGLTSSQSRPDQLRRSRSHGHNVLLSPKLYPTSPTSSMLPAPFAGDTRGGFKCEHPDCTALPFQTQYLLKYVMPNLIYCRGRTLEFRLLISIQLPCKRALTKSTSLLSSSGMPSRRRGQRIQEQKSDDTAWTRTR